MNKNETQNNDNQIEQLPDLEPSDEVKGGGTEPAETRQFVGKLAPGTYTVPTHSTF